MLASKFNYGEKTKKLRIYYILAKHKNNAKMTMREASPFSSYLFDDRPSQRKQLFATLDCHKNVTTM